VRAPHIAAWRNQLLQVALIRGKAREHSVPKIAVVTGASAGVGRAAAVAFAKAGFDVGLLARNQERLGAAEGELRRLGAKVCAVPTDVADAAAVEAAADRIERELGPIDVWVNNAMATVFAPVHDMSANEFRRGTEVTYLGTVHGTMAALKRMRTRGRGTIVNVGSALSYRAVPLQSVYCGAKYAIRGFTDSLRSELIHEGEKIHLTMVHLSAMNTPQFDWALNRMGKRAQPMPPIYEPEVAARAIVFAATHRRREVWVGFPTVKAILANRIMPGVLDHILAHRGYSGQFTDQLEPPGKPANLFETVAGHNSAHGRFDDRSRSGSWEMWTSRHRNIATVGVAAVGLAGLCALLMRKRHR
jgi:short-subunit dehydrogenase